MEILRGYFGWFIKIFLYTKTYWDFDIGFKIVKELKDAVSNHIDSYNFNRYGKYCEGSPRKDADPIEHISIRLNLKNNYSRLVEEKLQQMKEIGTIVDWKREEDNPANIRPMRDYPPVRHTAHETSSACAYCFWDNLMKNPNEAKQFEMNNVEYLKNFMGIWLKYSGFRLLSDLNNKLSPFKENLSKKCSTVFVFPTGKVGIINNWLRK